MSESNSKPKTQIWLEVSNVRKEGNSVSVQLKGDRTDREPEWWEVKGEADETFREISRGLDKKWTVLASLTSYASKKDLYVDVYRIQLADPTSF